MIDLLKRCRSVIAALDGPEGRRKDFADLLADLHRAIAHQSAAVPTIVAERRAAWRAAEEAALARGRKY